MTALDGWSESTRLRVRKPVTDEQIVDKLSWILATMKGRAMIKVFQIVGYPWETVESVREDVLRMRYTLARVQPGKHGSRIMMMFVVTPFSPEPLTEMEDEPANIGVNWREVLLDDSIRCVFDSPHLNAFTLPQINSPLTLFKRVCVNRGLDIDRLRLVAKAKTLEDAVGIGGDLHCRGAGERISGILSVSR